MHCPQTALLASPFAQLSRDDSDTKMDQSLSPRPLAVVLEPAARSAPSFTLRADQRQCSEPAGGEALLTLAGIALQTN